MSNTSWNDLSEEDFRKAFFEQLDTVKPEHWDFVTGPGRSGAVAAVYASHYLGIPYIPHKAGNYERFQYCLVVDTVVFTGRTIRKAVNWYRKKGLYVSSRWALDEWRGHYFKLWYENYSIPPVSEEESLKRIQEREKYKGEY